MISSSVCFSSAYWRQVSASTTQGARSKSVRMRMKLASVDAFTKADCSRASTAGGILRGATRPIGDCTRRS